MTRIPVALVALLALTGSAYGETPPVPAAAVHSALFTTVAADIQLLRTRAHADAARSTSTALICCKVRSVGKACGNTCISRDKTCHVRQGCACDG
jgi:hypothetical protein